MEQIGKFLGAIVGKKFDLDFGEGEFNKIFSGFHVGDDLSFTPTIDGNDVGDVIFLDCIENMVISKEEITFDLEVGDETQRGYRVIFIGE